MERHRRRCQSDGPKDVERGNCSLAKKFQAAPQFRDHGHRGTELTLVLKGVFADEEDRFAAGDVEVANEDLTHTPIAEPGEDCICPAATDAPLEFKGIIPRIAQKFIVGFKSTHYTLAQTPSPRLGFFLRLSAVRAGQRLVRRFHRQSRKCPNVWHDDQPSLH